MHGRGPGWPLVTALALGCTGPPTDLVAPTATATAHEFTWLEAAGGAFRHAPSWSPHDADASPAVLGPGGADDRVRFDLGSAEADRYTVTGVHGANDRLVVGHDALTLALDGDYTAATENGDPGLVVGDAAGDVGDLIVTGDEGTTFAASPLVWLGQDPDATGALTLTGPGWTFDGGAVYAGWYGTGTLVIEDGAFVDVGSVQLALFGGSSGTARVAGVGTRVEVHGSVTCGSAGDGGLTVEGGAALSGGQTVVGNSADATGSLTVTGEGTLWTARMPVLVGYDGGGTVLIEDGATALAERDVWMGGWEDEAHGTGTATVRGAGSTWTMVDRDLTVATAGTGSLVVEKGGTVSDLRGWIGLEATATGSALVSGRGAHWSHAEDLFVGDQGTGTLVVEQGGAVSSTTGWLATQAGSSGTVTVRDRGSTWASTGEIFVGHAGDGQLTIERGGTVTNEGTWIGTSPGSTGLATVRGTGSTWSSTSSIVGYRSPGTLVIEDGGAVAVKETTTVSSAPLSDANVTVSDRGSTWIHGEDLRVGQGAPATVTIRADAAVTVGQELVLFADGIVSFEGGTLTVGEVVFSEGGTFDWTGGTLHVGVFHDDLVHAAGTLAPGQPLGATSVVGDYDPSADAVLDIELGGTTQGAWDRVLVSGSASLGGTLQVALVDGFEPVPGDVFEIVHTDGRIGGTFAQTLLPDLGDVALQVLTLSNSVQLEAIRVR